MKNYQGDFSGKGRKFGIVISRFNEFITQRLLGGALDYLKRHGVSESDIEIAWVPGSFEIPVTSLGMAKTKKYDAIITLGCIMRGDTDHYEHVASSVAVGIEKASVETGVPIILGVVTCDNLEQAIDRAGAKSGNRGAQAALAAIEMANLQSSLKR
jgi:6,7-dimethyl-8-ribityllumazine synthase